MNWGRVFRSPLVAVAGPRLLRTAAVSSFVVVFPQLPVIPIKVVFPRVFLYEAATGSRRSKILSD